MPEQAEQLVRWFAGAAHAAGLDEERVDPATLTGQQVLEALGTAHPQATEVLARCSFLADGRRLEPTDPWPVTAAVVDVLPPFTGG